MRFRIRLLFFKNQLSLRSPLEPLARTGAKTAAAVTPISKTTPENNCGRHLYHLAGHQGHSNGVGNAAFSQVRSHNSYLTDSTMKAHPSERWGRDSSGWVGGKTGETGQGAEGGSWPGESSAQGALSSLGAAKCRNRTEVILIPQEIKTRYNHGSVCLRFIYEGVIEVESNFRTRIKQKSIKKLVEAS